MHIVFNWIPV